MARGGYTRDNGDPEKPKPTLEGESEAWPTPRAEDSESTGAHGEAIDTLNSASRTWPTPGANDHKGTAKEGQRRGQLDEAAEQLWTTPQAHDQQGGDPNRVRRKGTEHGTANLADDVALWATPKAGDGKRAIDQPGPTGQDMPTQAATWATPNASAMNDGESPEQFEARRLRLKEKGINGNGAGTPLAVQASLFFPPDQATEPAGSGSSPAIPASPQPASSRRLNPRFVAWLMGWPDVTGCGSWGTAWSHWLPRMRSAFSGLVGQ